MNPFFSQLSALRAGCMGLAAVLLLAGCTSQPVITPESGGTGGTGPVTGYSGAAISGKAMAGTQPLIAASVELYAAGTSGNGSAGTALLSSALTTDTNGAFTVAAGYDCPASTSQLYIVARGGKPGATGAANGATVLITALGSCDQVASSVVVNEVTTVASAYALAQFLSAGGNLGATSTNLTGLESAIATAQALAGISTGTSPGPTFATNATSPAPRIDSVADLLNACVVSSSACGSLFSATTPAGGTEPGNTLDAVLNLVRNPAENVASLYTQSTASSAFSPVLGGAPTDWTLFVNYSGGGMDSPSGLGVDGSGNVWVANYFDVASVFSPLGKPLIANGITGYGLSASYGLAVDASGYAWIPNEPSTGVAGNSLTVLTSAGTAISGSGGFTAGGLDYPTSVAIDTDGSAWAVDYGNSHVTHLSSSGQALSGASGYTSTQFDFPVFGAIDASHNLWVANLSGTTVTKVASDGSAFTSYACCNGPSSLAIDKQGNVWVANYYGNNISEISSAGAVVSSGGYTGSGSIDHPQGIAIDGAGTVWVANFRSGSLSELAGASASVPAGTSLSPAAGLGGDAALLEAYAIAVDASGNLWVTNFGSNLLTEFVGLAVPVKTPLIVTPTAP